MSPVRSQLRVEAVDDTHWRLLESFTYDSEVAKARITVPAGFVTDFASVPRLPLAFLLTGDTAHMAAVVHDFLYSIKIFPRETADAVFYEAMRATGVPAWRAYLMWLGVRVGGQIRWDRKD